MPAPNASVPSTREYDAQLRRAEYLSSTHPASREVLTFYSKIISFQKTLRVELAQFSLRQSASRPSAQQFSHLRDSLDLTLLLPHFRPFLALVEQHAPKPLATAAHRLSTLPASDWTALLTSHWQSGGLPNEAFIPSAESSEALTNFFPRAFLHAHAAHLAAQRSTPPASSTPNLCPLCGALPLVGVLRPEGDGAKRTLLCSFCSTEWNFRRILCASCGETDEPKLPVFIAAEFSQIRTECCDTCRTYLRTVDLSKDGHAIPVVDDLAALPLSLWAHEHNYSRLYANLLHI